MTETVREQILTKVTDILTDIGTIPVERNRLMPAASWPLIVVRDSGQQSILSADQGGDSVSKQHLMQVEVEGFVRSDCGTGLGKAMNALYGEIVTVMLADYTLGGLAQDVRENSMDIIWEEPGETLTMAFLVTFEVEYYTGHSDPYSLAP